MEYCWRRNARALDIRLTITGLLYEPTECASLTEIRGSVNYFTFKIGPQMGIYANGTEQSLFELSEAGFGILVGSLVGLKPPYVFNLQLLG
jgi:hypothetical protein